MDFDPSIGVGSTVSKDESKQAQTDQEGDANAGAFPPALLFTFTWHDKDLFECVGIRHKSLRFTRHPPWRRFRRT